MNCNVSLRVYVPPTYLVATLLPFWYNQTVFSFLVVEVAKILSFPVSFPRAPIEALPFNCFMFHLIIHSLICPRRVFVWLNVPAVGSKGGVSVWERVGNGGRCIIKLMIRSVLIPDTWTFLACACVQITGCSWRPLDQITLVDSQWKPRLPTGEAESDAQQRRRKVAHNIFVPS